MILPPNSKAALLKGWNTRQHSRDEIEQYLQRGNGVAIRTDNLTVVDVDRKPWARWFYKTYLPLLAVVVETRRGAHFYFTGVSRNATNVNDQPYDLRSGCGGYAIAPPTTINTFRYRYVMNRWDDLRPLPTNLLPAPASFSTSTSNIHDARAYISKIFAISGSGGHNSCFRAVCKLKIAGLDELEAFAAIMQWNATNTGGELFSEQELLHKIKSVYRRKQ